ncbi:ubiquitin-like protein Pup [Corynebacterium ulceribovis]|uniref:ubiquitin-like protein Pup n=1 Tax=Corynebacterium ulceribovis TaxID=487732 RepID=UPI00037CAE3B|nr:ubiquitin-like protein Pup [Corynebacterium ulceribovis]
MADIRGTQISGGGNNDGDDAIDEVAGSGQAQQQLQHTDDLLDEIDDLLESNAEEFVRSYVQKGGQ